MYILKIEIDNLYGKQYNIEFKEKLTILYGLNGSGKTTILNILNLLISGDFNELMKYRFNKIICETLNQKGQLQFIEINKTEKTFTVEIDETVIFEKINENSFFEKKNYINIFEYDSLDSYESREINKRTEMKKILDTIYLPLDRNVIGSSLEFKSPYTRRLISTKKPNSESRIDTSLKIAQAYYKDYNYFVKDKSTKIQKEIEKSMLEEISLPIKKSLINFNEEDLKKLSDTIKKTFENNQIYKNILELIKQYNILDENDKEYHYVLLQLNKLNNVVQNISEKKEYLDELLKVQLDFKKEINLYFNDTDKKIIEEKTMRYSNDALYFNNEYHKEPINLNLLSSGEKQLIILLIFSMLSNQKNKMGKVFLVDEPELSLHIAWQKKLLDTMLKYSKKTQIIIATHSPDIINNHYSNLVEIRGEFKE